MKFNKYVIGIAAAFALCGAAMANPCATMSNNSGQVGCIGGSGDIQSQGQGQSQSQGQTATGGTSNATGGAVTGSGNSTASGGAVTGSGNSTNTNTANGGSGGQGGSAASASRSVASSTNSQASTNIANYQASAPGVSLPTQFVTCGTGGSIGGSNTHGAGALGIEWTTKQCYDNMTISNYIAMKDLYDACEMNQHTPSSLRAIKNGAKFQPCENLLPPPVVYVPVQTDNPNYVTQDQLQEIERRITTHITSK